MGLVNGHKCVSQRRLGFSSGHLFQNSLTTPVFKVVVRLISLIGLSYNLETLSEFMTPVLNLAIRIVTQLRVTHHTKRLAVAILDFDFHHTTVERTTSHWQVRYKTDGSLFRVVLTPTCYCKFNLSNIQERTMVKHIKISDGWRFCSFWRICVHFCYRTQRRKFWNSKYLLKTQPGIWQWKSFCNVRRSKAFWNFVD